MGAAAAGEGGSRIPELDWLKGIAILGVLFIHARPLVGTLVHDYGIDRAVPIFIVLFGMSSDLWWRRRGERAGALAAWYRGRLVRLMIPVWAVLAIWWPLAFVSQAEVPRGPGYILASLIGYTPYLGTFWFVTLILQWVLLFPALRAAVDRLGLSASLVLSLGVTFGIHLVPYPASDVFRTLTFDTAPGEGWIYWWFFSPQYLWLVVAGIALARIPRLRGVEVGLIASLVFFWGAYAHSQLTDPLVRSGVQRLLDVPLTVMLLVAMPAFRRLGPLAKGLAACGTASWGLYLGQMLIYDAMHLFGRAPENGSLPQRFLYVGGLLAGAALLTLLGSALRKQVFRRRGESGVSG